MSPTRSTPTTSWSGTRRSFPTGVAQRIIRRDKTCRVCGSTQNLQADHIVNHAEALLLGWTQAEIDSESNGQALCDVCHDKKSKAERARGLARFKARVRPVEPPHPGMV